jgi:hypothetical protein
MKNIILLTAGLICFTGCAQNTSTPETSAAPTVSAVPTLASQSTVPLPQETDIVRNFFNLINERRISEAVGMMSDAINQDESQKQAWGVQLNTLTSVKVLAIEPSLPDTWNNTHVYKVTFEATVDPSAANAPIPYYGWDNGKNIRWVELQKVNDLWKITGLATGP